VISERFLSLIFLAALASCQLSAEPQNSRPIRLYVWDFKTNLVGEDRLRAQQLTTEFETVLIQSQQYDVLERRNLASVIKQRDEEVSLLEQLSPDNRRVLQLSKADGVVFGEVYHDSKAGEVNVSVSLQFFDSRKAWSERKACAYRDLFRQEDRMNLVRSLLPNSSPSGSVVKPIPREQSRQTSTAASEGSGSTTAHLPKDSNSCLQMQQQWAVKPSVLGQPSTIRWQETGYSIRNRQGQQFVYSCPPGGAVLGVWGGAGGLYSTTSSLCSAAVHRGVISASAGGLVGIFVDGTVEQPSPGSLQHNVSARQAARGYTAFHFVDPLNGSPLTCN
jgi:hypothetical protein